MNKIIIEAAFESKETPSAEVKDAVKQTLALLDSGQIRVCEKDGETWKTNQWIKKAILLSFRINANYPTQYQTSTGDTPAFYDKVPLKYSSWNESDFKQAGFRMVAGAVVRHSAFIAKNTILMPSFVNVGAYVDSETMIDTWSTVGSCAQIGKRCHISGGVGIGGVLEPIQANPVIIEDDCFIGARSEVAEGVIIEKGSVISMGVYLGASTKIVDRATGEIFYGRVPAYSVVVPGTISGTNQKNLSQNSNQVSNISLYAAIIVKRVDEKTRSKTSINELLRS